ncbi:MAG: HNH endonuclease [Sedimentisphaerales bacterium]
MKFELEEHHRNTPEKELIADLKRVANDLQKSPTIDEYNERGSYHSTTLTRRFGGWPKALKAAGLSGTRSPLNISEEELFQNLQEIWIKLGRQPRYQEIQKPLSKYSAGTYENRFGSWRKALEKFVVYVNREGSISSEAENKSLKIEPTTRHKTSRTVNWRLRFLVMRRDDFKCKLCGISPAIKPGTVLHVNHIKPWSKGGETVMENLDTLCEQCNIGRSNLSLNKDYQG